MNTPVYIKQTPKKVINSLLPDKSSNHYWKEFEIITKSCNEDNVNHINEYSRIV